MKLDEALDRRALLLERARYMRKNPTDAEKRLWAMFRDRRIAEMKWKRQQIIDDRYIVDFICFEDRLIVEADGGQHSDNKYDEQRDAYLKKQGFQVMRFWNSDILSNVEGVTTMILAEKDSIGA